MCHGILNPHEINVNSLTLSNLRSRALEWSLTPDPAPSPASPPPSFATFLTCWRGGKLIEIGRVLPLSWHAQARGLLRRVGLASRHELYGGFAKLALFFSVLRLFLSRYSSLRVKLLCQIL